MPDRFMHLGDELSLIWIKKDVYVTIKNAQTTACGSYGAFMRNRAPQPMGYMRMGEASPPVRTFDVWQRFVAECTNQLTGFDLQE